MTTWPQTLAPVTGPFAATRIDGAAKGMGASGPATCEVVGAGLVQPDLLTGMTLLLLARQPRAPRTEPAEKPAKASPIAGGVWVREQFTIHRPLQRLDPFVVTGESTGRYVRKGRRYGTTTSQTHDTEGRLVATNLTTGLLSYRAEDGLTDQVEGLPLDDTPSPDPDWGAAAANPSKDRLATATVGQVLGGDEVIVSLATMAARDTASPDNPIHSDPEAAKAAGLKRPIAGGSHVLAFALEPIMATFGPEVLFHGAHFDARWKAPTHADTTIKATATVAVAEADRVGFDLHVTLVEEQATAMVGSVVIPIAR